MLRIWAVIAGLYLGVFAVLGQAPPGNPVTLAPEASAAYNPAGGTPTAGQGVADPVPQVMQVYVMSAGPSTGGSGNAAAAQDGVESQGTAFYLDAGGQKVIVAPYHAWAMAGASPSSGQVYLAGQVKGTPADGAKWTWWSEQARVLGADPAADVVFLAVPPQLKDVDALVPAGSMAVGRRLHGSGYAGGMIRPNRFDGDITYFGSETESAAGGWQLNFQGYGLQGGGVEPGDSGSPALTADGRVAGEVVAAGNGWILVVPSTTIEQALAGLPKS
ncbi:MAG: hypothetical protein M0Z41_05705 [Peptococcaceae bacterium]|jgi:hypothetical protein|nr:hypothetical protein [Peptococcaceae bacterium]